MYEFLDNIIEHPDVSDDLFFEIEACIHRMREMGHSPDAIWEWLRKNYPQFYDI